LAPGLAPPLCGTPDALCGEECCELDCSDIQCGPDKRCGLSCGTCDTASFCTIDGRCELDTGVATCAGDLRATPPKIAVEAATGDPPVPLGGTIADGIYDLVATRAYSQTHIANIYERSALRFSTGGTQLEQSYNRDPDYTAAYDSPHRLLTVVVDGTALHFKVTCPDDLISIDVSFDRGFTVQGAELWLIQPGFVEIYRARN
jgi:hypothetical protein